MAKNKKIKLLPIEKTLTITGLVIIGVGIIASLFNVYTNQRFIQGLFPTGIYYFSDLILLGGGFIAGYFLSKKQSSRWQRLYTGVCYAFLAYTLSLVYWVFTFLGRLAFGEMSYPWGMYAFDLAPAVALLATIAVAIVMRGRKNSAGFGSIPRWIFIIIFMGYQLYSIANTLYYSSTASGIESIDSPIWITIGSYLINPIIVAVITYFTLSALKNHFDRVFYGTFVGAADYILLLALSNFRTDPTVDATNLYETFVLLIIVLATAVLLLTLRRKSTQQ